MEENKDYIKSDYFYSKCVWAIACSNDSSETINYLFNVFNLDSSKMFDVLKNFLETRNDWFLDGVSKRNIGHLIKFLKNGCDDRDKFNKIESILNESDFELIDRFVLSEYEKRFMYKQAPSIFIAEKNKERYRGFLKSLIVNDMHILISHSSRCDSGTFNFNKLPEILKNEPLKYICSINAIIAENPQILSNQLFVNRIKTVCVNFDSLDKDESVQKIYTRFKQKNGL